MRHLAAACLLLALAAPAAGRRPPELEAYAPGTFAPVMGFTAVRLVPAYMDLWGIAWECRGVTAIEWRAPARARLWGVKEGGQVAVFRFRREGTFSVRYRVRGGNCRGAEGEVEIRVRNPRKHPPLNCPFVAPGICGPCRRCAEKLS